MSPISTLRRHCDIAARMINQIVRGQKPALSRAPASDSATSQESDSRQTSVASSSVLADEDRLERGAIWGYVYAAATFAKAHSHMSKREQQFAHQVSEHLKVGNTVPGDAMLPPPTREQTIKAQIAQWRAEDAARARMDLCEWDEF